MQAETQSLIGSMRSFASTAASTTIAPERPEDPACEKLAYAHIYSKDAWLGKYARSAIYSQRAKRLAFPTVFKEDHKRELEVEHLNQCIEKVSLYLEKQQLKYREAEWKCSSPEEATTFLEWVIRSRKMLHLHYSTTQKATQRAHIIKEIERIGQIIDGQQERANTAYALSQFDATCRQLGIINIDNNNIEMEQQ